MARQFIEITNNQVMDMNNLDRYVLAPVPASTSTPPPNHSVPLVITVLLVVLFSLVLRSSREATASTYAASQSLSVGTATSQMLSRNTVSVQNSGNSLMPANPEATTPPSPATAQIAGRMSSSEQASSAGDVSSSNTVTVATGGRDLNARSGPGTEFSVTTVYADGTVLAVTGLQINGWIQLETGDWIANNWVLYSP